MKAKAEKVEDIFGDKKKEKAYYATNLLHVDYNKVSSYGHFGKQGLPWEALCHKHHSIKTAKEDSHPTYKY